MLKGVIYSFNIKFKQSYDKSIKTASKEGKHYNYEIGSFNISYYFLFLN